MWPNYTALDKNSYHWLFLKTKDVYLIHILFLVSSSIFGNWIFHFGLRNSLVFFTHACSSNRTMGFISFVGTFLGLWLCIASQHKKGSWPGKKHLHFNPRLTKCCILFSVQMMRAQKQPSPARQINVRGTRHKLGLANVSRPMFDIMRKSLATLLTLILARAKN